MSAPPTARDLAADLLAKNERHRSWIRDLLPPARARLTDPRERGLLTELAYGVIRHRGCLDPVITGSSRRPPPRLSVPVRTAIRLGVYQLLFLDRVPDHAAVNHAVSWARARGGAKAAGYVNAVLRAVQRRIAGPARGLEDPTSDVPREDGSALRLATPAFPDPETDLTGNLAARFSCPAWLVSRWLEERGPGRTKALLQAGITRPPLALRARVDRDALLASLREEAPSVRAAPGSFAILVEGGDEGAALRAVERGEAWVQDKTAQRVAPLVAPTAGERVLDLCAAPGGKALHLADLMTDGGEIVACDVDEAKVAAMSDLAGRVRHQGVSWHTQVVPAEGELPFDAASFDAILIDAPCTNTGVLRRRVEARWRLVPEDVETLAKIQRGLLERALPLLKPTGRLVYTTCSLEPEENDAQIDAFLAAHPELACRERLQVPAGRDADGGFAAVLTY